MAESVIEIISKPGVKRDGTVFEGDFYTDAQWCRWQRGRPRKMGGYNAILDSVQEVQRNAQITAFNGSYYVHCGSASQLARILLNKAGQTLGYITRTPAGFPINAMNSWQFGVMYSQSLGDSLILAHAAPNLSDISNADTGYAYYGSLSESAPLAAIAGTQVSGGICALYPYFFYYGSDGYIGWSDRGDPTVITGGDAGAFRATGEKVVLGIPTRAGGGNAPAGLFFATDALIRASYIGGTAIFAFDRMTSGYSILSPSAVVEYGNTVYWPGADGRFLMFNGVISEIDNPMNRNWFFDNLNWDHSQKVWGTAVPAFGEIWWFYPRGDATECSHAIIMSLREKTFYDTSIERACGVLSQTFRWPLWFGSTPENGDYTVLWAHEYGTDKIIGANTLAIQSYYETADFFLPLQEGERGGQQDMNAVIHRIEPDFVQTGDMTVQVKGTQYASEDASGQTVEFAPKTFSPNTKLLAMGQQLRQMRFRFESNVAGGDYQHGKVIGVMGPGDMRP